MRVANSFVDGQPVAALDHRRHNVLVAQRCSKAQHRRLHRVGVGAASRAARQAGRCAPPPHPGECASARMVAIPAGESALTTPSTSTQVPRISKQMPCHPHGRDCSKRQLVGDVTGQRAQPHSLRRRRRHAQPHQRPGRHRPHAHRVHPGPECRQHLVLDAHLGRAHQHRRDCGRRREADRVELLLPDARAPVDRSRRCAARDASGTPGSAPLPRPPPAIRRGTRGTDPSRR